jgi:hypothetical protein
MNKLVFDLEQFQNFHSAVFYDIDTKEYKEFVIHPARDERIEYFQYLLELKENSGLIGFNNIGYDYPLIHYILINMNELASMSIDDLVWALYKEGQRIINEEFTTIPEWKTLIKQLDLYRIHHFNNVAKATSLKHIQMAMRWNNLQELPFPYDHLVQKDEIIDILSYNKNDVDSTYKFYLESLNEIKFRKRMGADYNLNCINYDDVKIGENILITEIAKELKINKHQLRKMRTEREFIKLKECILPKVRFKSKEFNKALDCFKSKTVHAMNTKGVLDVSVIHGGMKYDFGLGGIHGTCGSGVFTSDEQGELILVDVSSYYSNLAIKNNFYPEHLTSAFCTVSDKMYKQRMQAKKDGDNQAVAGIKLALNGTFGKSNDGHSAMYDTQHMLRTTINGQLLLCMLSEAIALKGIKLIQINTDGILVKVTPKQKIELDNLCNKWMKFTELKLDYDYFKLIVQRDVNNYFGVFQDDSIKYKGTFAIDKEWHKDHSMKIVSKAISDYYIKNIPVRDTIEQGTDIYDYCISKKIGKQFNVEYHHIVDNKKVSIKTQRLNRFFISKNGGSIVKVKDDGSVNRLMVGQSITLFNKYFKSDNYHINYDFYVAEANKIIKAVDNGQLSMF